MTPFHTTRYLHFLVIVLLIPILCAMPDSAQGVSTPMETMWFTPAGQLTEPRPFHKAVVLADGRLLIVAGVEWTKERRFNSTAELYDPVSRTSTRIGEISNFDDYPGAPLFSGIIRLADGKVLLRHYFRAHLYDPATGQFSRTGNAVDGRYDYSATLLQNGSVLIAGGSDGAGVPEVEELYNPGSGTFVATGRLTYERNIHSATLLQNGKVLVVGGDTGRCGPFRPPEWCFAHTAELYDPEAGTFTLTGSMKYKRYGHAAVLLRNGKVLVVGGSTTPESATSAELYDPQTGTFSPTGSLTRPLTFARGEGLLPDGRVIVVGISGNEALVVEIYDPVSGTFHAAGRLRTRRGNGFTTTFLPSGHVIVIGGDEDVIAAGSVEIGTLASTWVSFLPHVAR